MRKLIAYDKSLIWNVLLLVRRQKFRLHWFFFFWQRPISSLIFAIGYMALFEGN
jgi:hypothetical protein